MCPHKHIWHANSHHRDAVLYFADYTSIEKYNTGSQSDSSALCPLALPGSPSPLTSPQAAEGQAVLAHQLAGQQTGLLPHGEAQQAQLGVADAEVHGGVPARSESWETEVEREVEGCGYECMSSGRTLFIIEYFIQIV